RGRSPRDSRRSRPLLRPPVPAHSTSAGADYSPAVWRDIILLGATLIAAPGSGAQTSVPLAPGRTTAVVVSADVGNPLERAVPSRLYVQAVTADSEQRWGDAAALYREAATEW